MKNVYISVLFLCGILFMSNSSCQKDQMDKISIADFNETFELGLNSRVVLAKSNSRIIIELTELSDSRCPSDVQCIWAGNASVNVKFTTEPCIQATATLCTGQCDKEFRNSDTALVNLDSIIYTVILKEVKPYPAMEGKKSATKKAILTVLKNELFKANGFQGRYSGNE